MQQNKFLVLKGTVGAKSFCLNSQIVVGALRECTIHDSGRVWAPHDVDKMKLLTSNRKKVIFTYRKVMNILLGAKQNLIVGMFGWSVFQQLLDNQFVSKKNIFTQTRTVG